MKQERLHDYKTWVTFADTDPAQRIYFARILDIAHRCLEDFALKNKYYDRWFKNMEWATPIRHTEAEYFKALFPGDALNVHMFADEIGKSSFTWRYVILRENEIVASVKTTHVTVDLKTGEKKPVPEELAKCF